MCLILGLNVIPMPRESNTGNFRKIVEIIRLRRQWKKITPIKKRI